MSGTVCLYTDSASFGGAEQMLVRLAGSLDRRIWRSVVLHHGGPGLRPMLDALSASGVQSRAVPPLPDGAGGARALPRFVRELRALAPAVFHAHLTWPFGAKFALAGAIAARVPAVVATEHCFFHLRLTLPMRLQHRFVARGVDRHLAVSRYVAHSLAATFPWLRGRLEVVPNFVDPSAFAGPPSPSLRAQLSVGGRRRVVLLAGRMTQEKGHDVLLHALTEVGGVQLVLAGEGPLRSRLEQLARSLGLADRVTFLGFRRDVPALLAASDVVALPSAFEGLPLAVLEAMAATRPVVATSVGGTGELVAHGRTGLLVPPADPPALADAIRTVLADPELARRMAVAGRAQVEQAYTPALVAARVARVYDEILEAPRAARRGGPAASPRPEWQGR